MIAIVGLISAALLLAFGRGDGFGTSPQPFSFSITVVASDAANLTCRGSFDVKGIRCGFDLHDRPVSTPAPLRPYLTVGRQMLLLTGVFEESHVSAWLTQARSSGSGARVTLDCSGTLLGRAANVDVRFQPQSPWGPERDITIGRADHCKVLPE
ncbi:MAG: hypothetical protein H7X95_09885 [Deltaproteobacteria bacterium]|nr:hypothetical protein [Deltaproteobacteria bacterium]